MGNCQAVDAATLVLQHPNGRVDNFYWPVSASEVMKMNPGHYVALLLSTTLYPANNNNSTQCPTNSVNNNGSVRLTRIKLLRPTDTLLLGHAYRLITAQEVMKGVWAKKQAKLKKNPSKLSAEKPERVEDKHGPRLDTEPRRSVEEKDFQIAKNERNRPGTAPSANSATAARSRAWQPSLRSISEATNSGS